MLEQHHLNDLLAASQWRHRVASSYLAGRLRKKPGSSSQSLSSGRHLLLPFFAGVELLDFSGDGDGAAVSLASIALPPPPPLPGLFSTSSTFSVGGASSPVFGASPPSSVEVGLSGDGAGTGDGGGISSSSLIAPEFFSASGAADGATSVSGSAAPSAALSDLDVEQPIVVAVSNAMISERSTRESIRWFEWGIWFLVGELVFDS